MDRRIGPRPLTPIALVAFVALGVLLAGCGDETPASGSGGGTETGTETEYVLCEEPTGSWTDLRGEDQAVRSQVELVNWTDGSGCAIRLDTVWHTFGDDHCDWADVEFISIGLPVGAPFTGPDADPPGQDWTPQFFFNTGGAVDGWPAGERIDAAELPTGAVDTGLRAATGRALFVAADGSALYEVQGDAARVFVPSDDQINCA